MKTKKFFYILLSFLLINTFLSKPGFSFLHATSSPATHHSPQLSDIKIKVLLKELTTPTKTEQFKISSSDGMRLQASTNPDRTLILKQKELIIEAQGTEIYLSGANLKKLKIKKQCRWISISPIKDDLLINGVPYEGTIKFLITDKNKLLLINTLNLDNYIYSVLRYEIFQSWPLEVQKVQAVASRTYAFRKISEARNKGLPYDIKNDNTHQVYKGSHKFKHLKEAVKSTKNMILTYNDKPAITMFDSCCGGIIPANMGSPQFKEAPYLARQNRCTFCQNTPFYSWEKVIKTGEFLDRFKFSSKFKNQLQNFGTLKYVKILAKDKAGIVQKAQLQGTQKTVTCKGNDLRNLMKDKIYSLSFSIKKNPTNVTITGHGHGHQLGLCQRGARELVSHGWDFKKILDFYYPKTKLTCFTKIKFKS